MSAVSPQLGKANKSFTGCFQQVSSETQQGIVNLYRYLELNTDPARVADTLQKLATVEFTGYEEVMLFPGKLREGFFCILSHMFQHASPAYRDSTEFSMNMMELLKSAVGTREALPVRVPDHVTAYIMAHPQQMADLRLIFSWLDHHKLSITQMMFATPERISHAAHDIFANLYGLKATTDQECPFLVRFSEALQFFYGIVEMYGIFEEVESQNVSVSSLEEIEAHPMYKRLSQIDEMIKKLVLTRAPHDLGFFNPSLLQSNPARFGFNGQHYHAVLGGQLPTNLYQDRVEEAVASGYLDTPAEKPFNLENFVRELDPTSRYQLFKLANKIYAYTYEEFADIVHQSAVNLVGICDYLFDNVDNRYMRAVTNKLMQLLPPTVQKDLGAKSVNTSVYKWLLLVHQLNVEKYHEHFDDEDMVENVTAVTPERFLMNLDNLRTAAIDEVVDQINLKLNDKEFTDRNVEYEFNFNRIRVHVPINPIGGLIWEGVRAKLESQGWDATVPLNTDYDGDNTPAFHVSLMASAAK